MLRFIMQMFIGLVLVLLFFDGSLTIKCIPLSSQPCLVRVTVIDLNLDQVHYCQFVISMSRCDGSCNTLDDPFGRICLPNKVEEVKLKVFNIM